MTSPLWCRDEWILAYDVLRANGWSSRRVASGDVKELVSSIKALWSADRAQWDWHRSEAGCSSKLSALDAIHRGKRSGADPLGGQVVDRFQRDPARLEAIASAIRHVAAAGIKLDMTVPARRRRQDSPDGYLLLEAHRLCEETDQSREWVRKHITRAHRSAECRRCGVDMRATFGDAAIHVAQAHIQTPFERMPEARSKSLRRVLMCANCHGVVHATGERVR